jgi:hypothetical protein
MRVNFEIFFFKFASLTGVCKMTASNDSKIIYTDVKMF